MQETKTEKRTIAPVLVITAVLVIILSVVGVIWFLSFQPVRTVSQSELVSVKTKARSTIDPVVASEEEIAISFEEEVDKYEVYQMPEFLLAIPEKAWFSQNTMRIVGSALGLTDQASVENLGKQYVWQEGPRTVLISPTTGLIKLSTAFNTVNVELSNEVPTQGRARQTIEDFFSRTGLPDTFFDFEAMEYSLLDYDSTTSLGPSIKNDGPLMQVDIPYAVSGVRMVLPISSYVVIDGAGEIFLMSLLIPNVKQGEAVNTLVSWSEAKDLVDAGVGLVIKENIVNMNEITVDRFYPAYYINSKSFYSLGQPRILSPVYIFEGEEGQVAVIAN